MNPRLRIRLLTPEDLGFADTVRELAGWNQTIDDWSRMLATEPGGCFLAEWEGTRAGTATTTTFGSELAWIGMVLVHPDYRRRGIGRALLKHCLDHLRQRGVRSIKLDATPAGRPVYQRLGFRDEWTIRRWVRDAAHRCNARSPTWVRPWCATDASLVADLDRCAFGASREPVLGALGLQRTQGLVAQMENREADGYGLLRPGSRARYLGPVVARSPEVGLKLIEELLRGNVGHVVYWDIPDPNAVAVAFAEEHGFSVQRSLTRMLLGEDSAGGDPRLQFALGGPEIG